MKRIYDFGVAAGTTEYYRLWRAANKDRVRARAKKYYDADPAKQRERSAKYRSTEQWRQKDRARYERRKANGEALAHSRKYRLPRQFGITVAQYNDMLAAQNGGCAICRSPHSKVSKFKYLCVDHCHDTNKVRGLLCNSCNTAIGHLNDSPSRAFAVGQYLLRHQQIREVS